MTNIPPEEVEGWSKVQYSIGYNNGFTEGQKACLADLIASFGKDKRVMLSVDNIIASLIRAREKL